MTFGGSGVVLVLAWAALCAAGLGLVWWLRARAHTLSLPSYTLSKQQYHDLVVDPTAAKSFLPDAVDDRNSPRDYPSYFPLIDVLTQWPAINVERGAWLRSLSHPSKGHGLYRLDFMVPKERQIAALLRDHELPFVLYNIPELDQAAEAGFSLPSLLKSFEKEDLVVERSQSTEFMYFLVKNSQATERKWPQWRPPQERFLMTFRDFLTAAERAESSDPDELFYTTVSGDENGPLAWILQALPFFAPRESLFMRQDEEFRGIKCRFGMKGIAAAAHFDSRRNFVAMVRGSKRYVLLPPEHCADLKLFPRGHPSARHSSVPWTDLAQVKRSPRLAAARAVETVLRPGEMLYIPSFWMHYIVSQDASVQCNCRSGEATKAREVIGECGFNRVRGDEAQD